MQIGNNGYIILGEVDRHPYLLQVDTAGEFSWATDPNAFADYKNPIPGLLIYGEHYYFFCNKIFGTALIPTLLKCSKNTGEYDEVTFAEDLFQVEGVYVNDKNRTILPLHASKTPDDKILLLAFDEPNGRILLRIMDFKGTRILKYKHDNYFQDICRIDYPIRDKRLHFTGLDTTGNNFYYFQSFSRKQNYVEDNVCFRFAKMSPVTGEYIKKDPVNGESIENPFSIQKPLIVMKWHNSERFSAACVDNNLVSYFVNSNLDELTEKEGHPQYESIETESVYIETMEIKGKEVVFFVGTTKTSKIVLAVFDVSTGLNLYNYYIGDVYPYSAAGLTRTDDEGLAILGNTFYLYRINRICLFKLSKTELENMVPQ
jgi:hypothetical protein